MKKKLFYFLASLFILSACGPTTTVYSDKLQGVNFSQFQTYAILPIVDSASSSLYHNAILEQNLVNSINREMRVRGYVLDTENPDILVNLHLKLKDKEETVMERYPLTSTYDYYTPVTDPLTVDPGVVYPPLGPQYTAPYYYPYYNRVTTVYGTELKEIEYTQGTVVIDIIRSSDNHLIWRGWSQEIIQPDIATSELQYVVEQIYTEYPVAENKK